MFVCLLVQEVKHVLDGEGQGAPAVCCAEDGLKQVVHELLERTLRTNAGLRRGSQGPSLSVPSAEHRLSARFDRLAAERPGECGGKERERR